VYTFETWKFVHLPPECFQSQSPKTESSCAQAPRQVLGSLEETQLPLFHAKGEEKGANTGESGGGGYKEGGGAHLRKKESCWVELCRTCDLRGESESVNKNAGGGGGPW